MRIYGSKKTSFKSVRFDDRGTKFHNFTVKEEKFIENIDRSKFFIGKLIPIKANNIGRLWTF